MIYHNSSYYIPFTLMSHSIICDITQHYSTPVASIITMQSIWIKFHHLISGQPLKLSISCHKIWVFVDLLMIIHNGWVISQKKKKATLKTDPRSNDETQFR